MRDRLLIPRPGIAVPRGLTRRGFLAGVAAAGLLAACGDDDTGTAATDTMGGDDGGGEGSGGLSVVRFYGPYFAAGQAARVPFGLSDDDGLLSADLAPAEVAVTVRGPEGDEVASGIMSTLQSEGLPRPYYAFEFTPEAAGFFDFVVDTGDGEVVSQVQVVGADDETVSSIIGPGDLLPQLQTPTVDDPRGVTPICTREPACDLHARTAAEVVAAGEPLALIVATPAFCQTTICGPVLDVLLDVLPEVPGVTAVHAEVYADPQSGEQPLELAPVVGELGLPFEPVLYTVGADGVVRRRLDYIFGSEEVRQALEDLVA